MPSYVHVIGTTDLKTWNLSFDERLRRQLARLSDVELIADPAALPPEARVLLLRADYVTEVRTLQHLRMQRDVLLRDPATGQFAAAMVGAADLAQASAVLRGEPGADAARFAVRTPGELAAYDEALRRAEPPLLEHLTAQTRAAVEDKLYGNAYKGITDLITKWLWPRPAKWGVRWCARLGITPNMVTMTGILLVLVAGALFYQGMFLAGLLAAWIMTYLDTVDGKLARVTVQSSRFGHAMDHGVDIVHPPFWYLAWGMALMEEVSPLGMQRMTLYWLIMGGYVGGRLAEAAFHALGACSIFTWRPFDAYFRLITARRNPCLIILTATTLIGQPDWGFVGVTAWTVLTTLVLVVRLLQGAVARLRGGPLQSWLHDRQAAAREHPQAFMTFAGTRSAYGTADTPFAPH